mmetsp:Transcript_26942/g.45164  ORF Transcript_26942/g.45164 Transcript_26942/m.45164 type:complete len:135 (-) Transcript_26942:622-1026(-)
MARSTVTSKELLHVESNQTNDIPSCLLLRPEPAKPTTPAITKLPPSKMLGQLKAFLPQLEKANTDLHQRAKRECIDIESVPEGAEHIEMNLACGVLDVKEAPSDSDSSSVGAVRPPTKKPRVEVMSNTSSAGDG